MTGDSGWGAVARSFLDEGTGRAAAGAGAPAEFGDYLLEEEIARGGMGIVYRAWQTSLARAVAVKVLREGLFADGREVERFRQEASAAAALRHPGIVPVFDSGEAEGRIFYAMEWIGGPDLARAAREHPPAAKQAAQWVREVALAVQYAHDHGVIHRDLKPANVLLDEEGRTRVTDFGMARREDAASGLTLSGQMLGTPGYMAPEMASGGACTTGAAVDIYGLGALLFHLLTGRAPFIGESHTAILRQLAEADPVAPRLLNPSVPRDLETICLKALSREPARRYAKAQDMAGDIGRFLNGEPIHARPVPRLERAWRWCRRKPALAASLAGLALLAAGIITTIALSNRRIEGLRREAVERLYASDMRLALQNIAEGKYGAAAALVDRHDPAKGGEDLRGFEWYLARQFCRSDEMAALEPMQGQVRPLAWSPDGKWIAAGAENFQLWEMMGDRPVLRHSAPGQTRALAFSPDSRRLGLSQTGGKLLVVDPAAAGTALFTAQIPEEAGDLAWRADGAALEIFANQKQWRWTPGEGEPAVTADFPGEARLSVLNPTGTLGGFMLFGPPNSANGYRVCVWDAREGKEVADVGVTNDRILNTFATSNDGRWLATGDLSGRLTLREAPFTSTAWDELAHRGMVNAIAFFRDGSLIATAGDQVIHVRSRELRYVLGTLRGHRSMIKSLAFSPDGTRLISGDQRGGLKLWATPNFEAPESFRARGSAVAADGGTLAWGLNTEGKLLCLQHWGGAARIIDLKVKARTILVFDGGIATAQELLGSSKLQVYVEDGPPGGVEWILPGQPGPCSADGRWFYFLQAGTGLPMLADRTGQRPHIPLGDEKNPAHCHFSADSRRFVMGFRDGGVRVTELATGKELCAIKAHSAWAYGTALSADGTLVATVGFDGAARLWDVASGRMLRDFPSNADTLWSVALSPDGTRMAAGTSESTVILWDIASGRETGVVDIGVPRVPVEILVFTPDSEGLIAHGQVLRAPQGAGK